jgi:uncharacterized membrane protein
VFRIEYVFWLCGALLLACALRDLRARRFAFAAFWAVLGASLLGGDAVLAATAAGNPLPAQITGMGVIALALLAGSGKLRRTPDEKTAPTGTATRSDRLFVPALLIPLGTLALILLQPYLHVGAFELLDPKQPTLTALCLACLIAALVALHITRAPPSAAIGACSGLLNTLSWAALLPILLAMLGAVFAATGVGDGVAHVVAALIPTESRLACLVAYALGMALFTIVMGNAFAAFPVMTAGVGLPLLVIQHHADPAALGALGMLAGYCGTLLTPMAANYNVIPVALLELRDPYAVIRAQLPTAVVLFGVNFVLLDLLAFR